MCKQCRVSLNSVRPIAKLRKMSCIHVGIVLVPVHLCILRGGSMDWIWDHQLRLPNKTWQ